MRVIIATDGSIEAEIAEMALSRLPFPKDTSYTVAMVSHTPIMAAANPIPGLTIAAGERNATDAARIAKNVACQTTERVAQRLRDKGLNAEALVLQGPSARTLIDLANEQKADVIVAGCGVTGTLEAFFLGSVSRKLVLYSDASVLIGRHYADSPAEGSYTVLTAKPKLDLVVAVDGSPGSNLAVESLAALAEPVFGYVHVLAVEPSIYVGPGVEVAANFNGEEDRLTRAQALANHVAAKIARCAGSVEPVTAFGRASREICRIAAEKHADLIMMGANRHGALDRFLVGSCAYETATAAPCSVLILRDKLPMVGGDE